MNRTQFLNDPDVRGFLDFFSGGGESCRCGAGVGGADCLHHLEVEYRTRFPRILPADRHFHVIGFAAALARYAWPALDTFTGPPHPPLYDWASTLPFLTAARAALQGAIAAANEPAAWDAVQKILEWGVGQRSTPKILASLRGLCPGAPGRTLCGYLRTTQAALALHTVDTVNIDGTLIPYASSGMVKVHSLASDDGLVIFDSRVAATLTECINEYLRRRGVTTIPAPLRLMVRRDDQVQRDPRPLAGGANHPRFVSNHRWIACQVRASWLLQAALDRSPDLFSGMPMPERMHRLEAACFMMGAYLAPGPFHGRSFNFAGCP